MPPDTPPGSPRWVSSLPPPTRVPDPHVAVTVVAEKLVVCICAAPAVTTLVVPAPAGALKIEAAPTAKSFDELGSTWSADTEAVF